MEQLKTNDTSKQASEQASKQVSERDINASRNASRDALLGAMFTASESQRIHFIKLIGNMISSISNIPDTQEYLDKIEIIPANSRAQANVEVIKAVLNMRDNDSLNDCILELKERFAQAYTQKKLVSQSIANEYIATKILQFVKARKTWRFLDDIDIDAA